MNNSKLQLHKELLEDALSVLKQQEKAEEMWDFDDKYLKEREAICIMEYSAKLAALMQLAFNQVNVFPSDDLLSGKNNARVLGNIVINDDRIAEPA